MNRYKITATRSNGTELSDYFVEATEGAARKAFKECYRNEEYSDVKVELVAEYVQATKEQEREALAKIVKIIEGLGPGAGDQRGRRGAHLPRRRGGGRRR